MRRSLAWMLSLALSGCVMTQPLPQSLPAEEFAQLINDFSEAGGDFDSDNYVSNETSYLSIIGQLQQSATLGGAYIGVGPEQNFSYIAKTKARVAFIVDIRRDAVLQHLLYKALFQLSPTPQEFLVNWLSRAADARILGALHSLPELLTYIETLPADAEQMQKNSRAILTMIRDQFKVVLSDKEQAQVQAIYQYFADAGLDAKYAKDLRTARKKFPTLKQILLATDAQGSLANFLVSDADYQYVRNLQINNLIIPVVGNFAGNKALAAIGQYLRRHNLSVSLFYLSNVEQYLFADRRDFRNFANNVKALPTNDKTLLLRWVSYHSPHPAQMTRFDSASLLQKADTFMADIDNGLYMTYWKMVNTHYISVSQLDPPK